MASKNEIENRNCLKDLWVLRGYGLMLLGFLICGADPVVGVGLVFAGIALTHHDYKQLTSLKK